MVRFEEVLTKHIDWKLNMQALCAEVGVAERTLRMCCAEVLGVSPTRYVLLRRLNRARAALRRADPSTASVAEVARTISSWSLDVLRSPTAASLVNHPQPRCNAIRRNNLPNLHSGSSALRPIFRLPGDRRPMILERAIPIPMSFGMLRLGVPICTRACRRERQAVRVQLHATHRSAHA